MRLKGANQLLIVLKVLVVYREKSLIDKEDCWNKET